MFVFRNYTIENLFPSSCSFSGYGDISFFPEDEKELVWLYQVPLNLDPSACAREVRSFADKLHLIADRMKSNQTLYICSLMDIFPVHSIDTDETVNDSVKYFNDFARQLGERPNIRFIDISEYFNDYPEDEWINWKFYFISQMTVSPLVAKGFSEWITKRICLIKGQRKKCLILDLDNTLWGGVLGEDGINGIKIGGDYPGNAFLYFQEALIELSKQGVILAVCSKNNEEDVAEAWEKNPFIKLNGEYISSRRINWNNKADNIRDIVRELNIGLDSVVFIDDNPTERELVRKELPMVSVPEFPKYPYGLMKFYKEIAEGYFRTYELTEEDRKKTDQYKANAERATEASKFTNIEDFIKSLDIEIDLLPADEFNIPRIAQMTQKTNQFNLTTYRYTEGDITDFVNKGDLVYALSVKDKFGDNGITGAIIIRMKGESGSPEIDTFLLSCRILGKGIEDVFLKAVLKRLNEMGYKELKATYIPTAKNIQVKDFYERFDSKVYSKKDGTKHYTIPTRNLAIPEYYKFNFKKNG